MFRGNITEANLKASSAGVKAFLKFFYVADLEDVLNCPKVAKDLLEIAHSYAIKPLENEMKKIFIKRDDDWLGLDGALHLFQCTVGRKGLERLKEKAERIIKS